MGYLYICKSCGDFKELERKRKILICDTCNALMTFRYKTIRVKTKRGNYEKLIKTLPLVGEEDEN